MSVTSVGTYPVTPFATEIRVQPAKHNENSVEPKEKPHAIQSAAADVQKIGLAFNRKLQFVVDQNSNQVIVKVIDKDTDKVIKELPPEELQRLHNSLKETIGLLFDERV